MSDPRSTGGAENYDAERYFLGEMTPAEQEEFEGRMFESRELGDQVLDLHALAANAKAVMGERESPRLVQPPAEPDWADAFVAWFRPQTLWPAAAMALLVVSAYQGLVAIPALRRDLTQVMQPQLVAATVLRPLARGADNIVALDAAQPLVRLSFDVNWSGAPQQIRCRILDADGATVVELPVAPRDLAGSMEITFPSHLLEPGRHTLTLTGTPGDLEERFEFDAAPVR